MPNNKSGLLILDAHKNQIDIFLTAIWARQTYNPKKIIMPIAGYVQYIPILNRIVNNFAKKYGLTLMPVYRRHDASSSVLSTRLFSLLYPKTLTNDIRSQLNDKYIDSSLRCLNTESFIVLVSPYGGYTNYGSKVKYGVLQLLKEKSKKIITLTKFVAKSLKFQTATSPYKPQIDLLSQYNELSAIS